MQKSESGEESNRLDLFTRNIPVELQLIILQYCTAPELVRMRLVSKYWNEIAEANVLWEPLCLKLFPESIVPERVVKKHIWIVSAEGEDDGEHLVPGCYKAIENWKKEYITRLTAYKIDRQRTMNLHKQRMEHRYWMLCGVHMFHAVNGRKGFDAVSAPEIPQGICKPSVEVIKAMLTREDQLRLSPQVQARFADSNFDAITIAEDVQKQVAKEFGWGLDGNEDMTKLGIDIIRGAPALYPDHPEIRKIPHYLKYNRSRMGDLDIGHSAPDVNFVPIIRCSNNTLSNDSIII